MTLQVRKRLQPLDTNSININDNIKTNTNIRRTRSKIHILPQLIKDENLCRLQVHLTKDLIYDERNLNFSRKFSLETSNNHSNEQLKFNHNLNYNCNNHYQRNRCVSSTATSSTESIPDCKSISNADSSNELNNISNTKESLLPLLSNINPYRKKETIDNNNNVNDIEKKSSQNLDNLSSQQLINSQFYYTPSFRIIKSRKISVNVPRWTTCKNIKFRQTRTSLLASQTENLSDEAYLERHFKYEMEEKKVEKALQKTILSLNKQKKSFDDQNFISPIHNGRKWQNVVPKTLEAKELNSFVISVKNELPITAFGVTLPIMKSRQFQFER